MTIEITHRIISLTRAETSGSKSPMWRCETQDSQRVNVFSHANPTRDTYRLFRYAGYGAELDALALGQKVRWSRYPIDVTMRKSGDWWEVVAVAPRPDGACPDSASLPNLDHYRRAAQRWADSLFTASSTVVIWDSETTGLTDQDEIITLAIMDMYGETFLDVKLRPRDLSAVARSTHIHGITPDELADAPTFDQLYTNIRLALSDRIWGIYNASFDMKMLDQMCRLYGKEPIRPVGVVDLIQLTAEFVGDWNPDKESFSWPKLSEAADRLGVVVKDVHNALGDCRMTLGIVETIASWGTEAPF